MLFMNFKSRIYTIIEVSTGNDIFSTIYDYIMMVTIFLSLIPLAFKESNALFYIVDKVSSILFVMDYLLRLYCADLKLKKGTLSYFIYPFTFMAIIDLLSILPSFFSLSYGFKLFRVLRLFRTFRVFRAFKLFRYSRSIFIIYNVIKEQKMPLLAVCTMAASYVLISALVIFNVEPDTFTSFFDAVYWATVSLTTMGYGDIYPVTVAGRIVTMLSSFVGIAIIALPSGIITAGYMDEINKFND